ncbi:hypothetical protein RhiirB3_440545 [Rhizophagus irregularis]|nr:hypothetical protein RhiirB3_440545 [Rhizophagus irregularis]
MIYELEWRAQSERVQARQRLRNGYNFNEEQVTALIPFQKGIRSKSGVAPNTPATSFSGQEVKSEGDAPNASDPNTTRLANEKEERLRHENRDINYPDHFALESVKERLDGYDISNKPDLQALADVMIMFCIRPVEVKNLRISDGSVTGCEISRSDAISSGQLKDPGTPGIKCFRAFLKKYPRYLRNIGAVFAVVTHGYTNLSNAMTIASEALRHCPRNHTSSAKLYYS